MSWHFTELESLVLVTMTIGTLCVAFGFTAWCFWQDRQRNKQKLEMKPKSTPKLEP